MVAPSVRARFTGWMGSALEWARIMVIVVLVLAVIFSLPWLASLIDDNVGR